jgi:hypothetical protein
LGRKYGLLGYGRYSYDLFPAVWTPIPQGPPSEIWIAATTPATVDIWASSALTPVEIWNPVTFPLFGAPDG